jgi:hypothetical protein
MMILNNCFRIFWTMLLGVSFSAFSYYSFSSYARWCEEPIVINLDEKLAKIYEIPFPAVILTVIFTFTI